MELFSPLLSFIFFYSVSLYQIWRCNLRGYFWQSSRAKVQKLFSSWMAIMSVAMWLHCRSFYCSISIKKLRFKIFFGISNSLVTRGIFVLIHYFIIGTALKFSRNLSLLTIVKSIEQNQIMKRRCRIIWQNSVLPLSTIRLTYLSRTHKW